jgi:hypothetical protein
VVESSASATSHEAQFEQKLCQYHLQLHASILASPTSTKSFQGEKIMARTSASSRPLTDHNEIRRWAEERGAHPACVRGTGDSNDVGMIRLDFPGYTGDDKLEEISWDDWFDKFDQSGLALLVQDETARGQRSNFNKLVSRETAGLSNTGSSKSSRTQTSRRSSSSEDGKGGTSAGYAEDDFESSGDEVEADLELEEDADVEESRPVRASVAGNTRNQKRQSDAKRRTATRSSRSSRSVRGASSKSGGSRDERSGRTRSRTRKQGQATGRARSKAKKAPVRATSSASRTSRGRSTGRKRAA